VGRKVLPLLLAAAIAQPSVDLKECSRESVLLALRATDGRTVGVAEIDPPRLSMLDPEEARRKALTDRDARVKQITDLVLKACDGVPHFKQPEPPKPAEKPEAQR
jgi:hypothetical protein